MASQEPFSNHEKLLHYFAHRVKGRMFAAGDRKTQLEDIFQELVCAWCMARDKWEESHGVPFGAYLTRGLSNHINRWVQRELRELNLAPIDLDAEFMEHEKNTGTLHDILPDEHIPTPEEVLIQEDIKDYAFNPIRWREQAAELSPDARKFVELMRDPPTAVVQMFHGLQARAKYARDVLKIPSACGPKRVTGALVLDVMGIKPGKPRASIYAEIELLSQRVNQQ